MLNKSQKLKKVDVSRARVLDAAAHIFRERGFVGTTMRAIAQDAGIEAGSIYYHFKSKDELIGAVLDYGIRALQSSVTTEINKLPNSSSSRERIEGAIKAHVAAIVEYGDYTLAMRRVFGQVPIAVWKKHVKLREEYGDFWHKLLVDAQKQGGLRKDIDLTVARLFLLGGLNWTVEWFKPKKHSLEKIAETFSTLILDGMKK
jgi:AcrR family transcriptional regulator